jgi:hypothetical protein
MGTDRMPDRLRPLFFLGAAILAILVGLADQARGGITIGPNLLVIGYCILIPGAILK